MFIKLVKDKLLYPNPIIEIINTNKIIHVEYYVTSKKKEFNGQFYTIKNITISFEHSEQVELYFINDECYKKAITEIKSALGV